MGAMDRRNNFGNERWQHFGFNPRPDFLAKTFKKILERC